MGSDVGPAATVALLTFSQLAGAWRAASTIDRAAIAEVLPPLAGVLNSMITIDRGAAVDPARCGNCDHLVTFHGAGGCWHTLTAAEPGTNLVCQCQRSTVAGVTAAAANDLDVIARAIHRAICRPTAGDKANQDDEDIARAVFSDLLRAGRLQLVDVADRHLVWCATQDTECNCGGAAAPDGG